ncbi:hypothetical protein ACFOPN_03785 [Xanthomonas hyacinthi]|uniref:hypothetical protein n=1 Tax=Xanthomonas hyacinthi TaxID=56455 RepID=UPI001FCA95CD|nr:hypothetical protein [Xanthomonas hyacinthi]
MRQWPSTACHRFGERGLAVQPFGLAVALHVEAVRARQQREAAGQRMQLQAVGDGFAAQAHGGLLQRARDCSALARVRHVHQVMCTNGPARPPRGIPPRMRES